MGVNGPPWGRLPRFPLAALPTPLVRARHLEARVARGRRGPIVLVKRDDLSGFAAAGHKARQLEYLVGAALAEGCDVLVTGGGPSSNWCPAAAVAARVAGLECQVVSFGTRPERTHPNLAASLASGAEVRFTGDPDRDNLEAAIVAAADDLRAAGRRPFAVPRGGASPLGAVGMVAAAYELAVQLGDLEATAVVVATGSGGACAGLAAAGRFPVVGASVSRPLDEAAAQVGRLAQASASLLGLPAPTPPELFDVRGPGFGIASDEGEAAATVALHTEGLLLDPTYTAKAFALLLRLAEADDGHPSPGPLVFWHTGGLLSAADHLARTAAVGAGA
jgi:1-aminocyclopropane-1-carboxylate deaminase/D-cysteine desulfhydrase-like pyridoxal-dependent ACC family enzyme